MSYDLGTARGVIQMDYNGRGVTQALAGLAGVEAQGGKSAAAMNLLGKAGGLMGLTVAGGIAYALKRTADFEAQISNIGAVSGATGEELDKIRAKALQLGADTVFSSSEAASAMEELVKAGISTEDVLNGAADAAVALAAAGGISIPEAATIASNAMNQFNLTAQELPGVVDQIAGAANASAIDVTDLGQSLQQVGAVANLAGLSFKDTATAIALMGNAGIRGSDAGTSLKSMLQRLQPTTEKQTNLMQDLGIMTEDGANKFFDAQGKIKSLAGISGVLSKALEGQTNQQKLLNLQTLFGTDAIRAAAIVTDEGRKGVKAMSEEMGKTTAAEVAAKRMDNFKGSVEQLMGSLESVTIQGMSPVLVVLREFVDFLTKSLNTVGKVGGEIASKTAPGFEALGQVISDTLKFVGELIDMFDGLAGVLATLGLGIVIGAFNTLMGLLADVTGFLADNKDAVLIAFGAWLILANGGVAAVTAKLGYFAAWGVVRALMGLTALEGGATTAAASFKALGATVASVAASIAVVGAIVAAVNAWNAYKEAVKETDEALKHAQETQKSGGPKAISDEIANLKKMTAERKAAIKEFDDGGLIPDNLGQLWTATKNAWPGRWDDVLKVDEYKNSAASINAQTADLEATFVTLGQNLADVAVEFNQMSPSEAATFMQQFANNDPVALEKADALLQALQPKLDQAGISSADFLESLKGADSATSIEVLVGQMEQYQGKAGQAKAAQESLTDAAASFADEAADAAARAQELTDALDNLIGKQIGAKEAAIQWRDSLRGLVDQIKGTSGAIFGGSKDADANQQAILDTTKSIMDRIGVEADAGASMKRLMGIYADSRKTLIDQAVAAGADRDAMKTLLKQINFMPKNVKMVFQSIHAEKLKNDLETMSRQAHLTPKELKIIFKESGAKTAAERVKALRDYINGLHDKDAKIDAPGAKPAWQQIVDLKKAIDNLKDKDANIHTPGASFAADEVRRLREQIEALRDKNVTITTTVRKVLVGGLGGAQGGDGLPNISASPGQRVSTEGMLPSGGRTPADAPSLVTSGTTSATSGGGTGMSRLISGELSIDESGRAFISGVALDAGDDGADYADTLQRMGGL